MGKKLATSKKIPLLDLQDELNELGDEVSAAIQRVVRSGYFIGGPDVSEFEAKIASYAGVKHAIAMNSGTDALVIGLRALGVNAGDEVITTPFSFFATAEAISQLGAVPVFVDIEGKTFNIDTNQLERAVSKKTKAIIPVHLFGYTAKMDEIMAIAKRHGLVVLEDVAQAFGADFRGKKLSSIGEAGALSFFPSKNLGAYGDGGMLVTNDDRVAELSKMLRSHGSKVKYQNEMVGYNSRLDSIQAAILNVKLPRLDKWLDLRRKVASRYHEGLANLAQIVRPEGGADGQHSFYSYTIRVLGGRRDHVREHLSKAGIETMLYYPVPLHKLPLYRQMNVSMPVAERAASEVMSLPIWPQMPAETQAEVIRVLRGALQS